MNKIAISILFLMGLVVLPACNGDMAQPEGDPTTDGTVKGVEQVGNSPLDTRDFDTSWTDDWWGATITDNTFGRQPAELQLAVDENYVKEANLIIGNGGKKSYVYEGREWPDTVAFCGANRQTCIDDFKYWSNEIVKLASPVVKDCPRINWANLTASSTALGESLEIQALSHPTRILIGAAGTVSFGLGAVKIFTADFDQDWKEWTTRAGVGVISYFAADFFATFTDKKFGTEKSLSDTQLAALVSAAYRFYFDYNQNIATAVANGNFPGGLEAICPTRTAAEVWIEMAELP